jgi:hypothetical protein
VVECPGHADTGERRRYLRCLEPNRRVVIEVETP